MLNLHGTDALPKPLPTSGGGGVGGEAGSQREMGVDGTCPVIPKFSPLSLSLSPSLPPSEEFCCSFGAKSFLGVVCRDGSDSEILVSAVDSCWTQGSVFPQFFSLCS